MAHGKKYLLGLAILAYFFSVIGVPVYLHYCGGELEKVNFMVKANSCCDGENEEQSDNGCCKDEGAYVQNTTDFTIKHISYWFSQLPSGIFTHLFSFLQGNLTENGLPISGNVHAPPNLFARQIVSTSVLRI